MADPRNANRARLAHPSIVAAASVAASRLSAPLPKFWEEEEEEAAAVTGGTFPDMDAEDAERDEYLKDRKRETD